MSSMLVKVAAVATVALMAAASGSAAQVAGGRDCVGPNCSGGGARLGDQGATPQSQRKFRTPDRSRRSDYAPPVLEGFSVPPGVTVPPSTRPPRPDYRVRPDYRTRPYRPRYYWEYWPRPPLYRATRPCDHSRYLLEAAGYNVLRAVSCLVDVHVFDARWLGYTYRIHISAYTGLIVRIELI